MSMLILLFFFVIILFSLLWHDETSERPPNQSTRNPNRGNDQ